MLTKQLLKRFFSRHENNTALAHSSYKSLGGVEGGPQTVVDALWESYETLLFPTYNFHSWTEQHYFDIDETPSEMGIITEMARRDERFSRTRHPVHNFAVSGPMQEYYCNLGAKCSLGPFTPLQKVLDDNGMMISIGLDWNDSFTMIHQIEYAKLVDYRRIKSFSGIMVDDKGARIKSYSMYARRYFDGVTVEVRPAMEKLLDIGIIERHFLGRAVIHIVPRVKEFAKVLADIIDENPRMLYTT